MKKIFTFSELAQKISSLSQKRQQKIIAIDGGGGAGKTAFASCLQREIPGSHIVALK